MPDYQVILGTSHGATSHTALAELIATVFTTHGFEVHHNISGYAGGNIVRTYGRPHSQQVHAIQIEINAALLMTTSRQEFIAQISRGEVPARVGQCGLAVVYVGDDAEISYEMWAPFTRRQK